MALQMQQYEKDASLTGLTGVYTGQKKNELVFLGMTDLCRQFNNKIGNLFIGFDTRMKPAVVRMFYDSNMSINAKRQLKLGLMQIGEVSLQGVSLVPSVYSPNIAYRDNYVFRNNYNKDYWMDMISPDIIRKSSVFQELRNDVPPFFAFNGILYNSQYTFDHFFKHPMPNGSLYDNYKSTTQGYSLCASLFSPIGLDLDGPTKTEMKAIVQEYLNRRFYDYATKNDSGNGKIVTSEDLWEKGTIQPPRKGIWQESFFINEINKKIIDNYPQNKGRKILWVEQIGVKPSIAGEDIYLLIKLDDPNAYYPYFCAYMSKIKEIGNHYALLLYEFDSHLIQEIQFNMLEKRSTNFQELVQRDQRYGQQISDSPSIFGTSDPYYTDDVISFQYRTNVVLSTPKIRDVLLDSITWKVTKKFDSDNLEFKPIEISPIEISYPPSNGSDYDIFKNCLDAYKQGISTQRKSEKPYAPENQWYEVGPRLPDKMGGFDIL